LKVTFLLITFFEWSLQNKLIFINTLKKFFHVSFTYANQLKEINGLAFTVWGRFLRKSDSPTIGNESIGDNPHTSRTKCRCIFNSFHTRCTEREASKKRREREIQKEREWRSCCIWLLRMLPCISKFLIKKKKNKNS